MSDSPQIHLHIGHSKVASSTIQGFLRSNADEIRRQGFLIADWNFDFPRTGPIQNDPNSILREWMKEPETRRSKLSEALRRIHESCRAGGGRGAIVSSEFLARPQAAEWFGESAGEIPLRVMYYLRRQDRWLESAWKQWAVKKGISLGEYVENSIASGNPHFLDTARAWKKATDHITVRPIESVENIQAHFAEWCGLDFGRLDTIEPANRTFDWALLDLLSRNTHLFANADDNRVFDFLNKGLPDEAPRDGHDLMTAAQARRVWSLFETENHEIRRLFFPDLPPCDWDRPPNRERESGRLETFGSVESVYRNLAIQLMIAMNLHQRLEIGDPHLEAHWEEIVSLHARADVLGKSIARRFDRLRSRLDQEEARRRALEQRLKRLESRSLRRVLSAPFTGWKIWRKKKSDPDRQGGENAPDEES